MSSKPNTPAQAAAIRADAAARQAADNTAALAQAARQAEQAARDRAAAEAAHTRAANTPAPTQAAPVDTPPATLPTPPSIPTPIPTNTPSPVPTQADGKSASQRTATLAVTSKQYPGQTVNVGIREHLLAARTAPDIAAIVRSLVATMAGSNGAARSIPVDFRDSLPGSTAPNGRHNVGKLALDPDEGLVFTPNTPTDACPVRRIPPADFRDILAQTAQAAASKRAAVARDVTAVVDQMAAILAEPLWIAPAPTQETPDA